MLKSSLMQPIRDTKQSFMKSAALLALAMVFSQIIGLISKGLIGSEFGLSAQVDAFLASNRLTETLFNLVAGGALASAFIPQFSAILDKNETGRAWKLASNIATILVSVLLFLCLLFFIFAPQVVRYFLVPGFSLNDSALEAITVELLRIQLPSVVIFGLSGLLMGILNTNNHFLIPGLAPAMYQLGIMSGVLFLSKPFGIYGLAFGALLGSLLHLLIQVPQLLRIPGRKYTFAFGLRDRTVREVILLMIPRQIGASAVQLNFLVNNFIASYLPFGSISAVTWGLAIMLMPQAAIAQSVATVSLPLFSVQAARGETERMRKALADSLRLVILLAVPAAVGLILLGKPLVSLIFERRSFDANMTSMIYWALAWYSAGLVFHCVVEVVSRAFYALHDTKTPVIVLFGAMALNMVLSVTFARLFDQIGWMPHGGLALANTLATGLEMATLLILMRRRLKGLDGSRILLGTGQSAAAAAAMAVVLMILLKKTDLMNSILLSVLVGVAAGGLLVLGIYWLMKIDEISLVKDVIRKKDQPSSSDVS